MHDRRLPPSRRIDPETGEVERAPSRGRRVPRQPSSAPVEYLSFDWFPLRVTPGKERLARLLLEDRGLVTFCPMEVKFRHAHKVDKAKREKRQIAYPWHPGLVCVGIRQPYPWHLIMPLPVVQAIVSIRPDRPRRMRHESIGRLMQRFGEGRFVRPEEQRHMRSGAEFAVGDRVRVAEGILEGRVLEVQQISGNMARVFGQWFGADMGFDVSVDLLAKED